MARKCRRRRCRSPIYPTALADYSAGMHLVQGILLALLQRERTGEGQKVSVSLYDSMLAMQMQEAAMIMMRRLGGELGGDAAVGRVRDAGRRAGPGRRVQGQSAARHLRRAGDRRPVARGALRQPRAAVRAQGRAAARSSASASATQHARSLARAAGGAGPAVRAGARPARGAGRSADRCTTRWCMEGRRRRAARCASSAARSACRPRRSALRRVPPRLGEHTEEVLAEARGTARREAGHERAASRSRDHVATRDDRPARRC